MNASLKVVETDNAKALELIEGTSDDALNQRLTDCAPLLEWVGAKYKALCKSVPGSNPYRLVCVNGVEIDRRTQVTMESTSGYMHEGAEPDFQLRLSRKGKSYSWRGIEVMFDRLTLKDAAVLGIFSRGVLLFEFQAAPRPTGVKPRQHFDALCVQLKAAGLTDQDLTAIW